ncbi:hypothetical protein ZIOFF_061845 [Zingiber officinale]|uniref:Reverse transcriptase zinc-binding domain-containing protein n=1 Tax=Zingiber officinale TaxID=94328 RepID=A0A8J5F4S5_ZINOF|nr:hypothetical protein ZIOFF_061845 [Zingiber officinale]
MKLRRLLCWGISGEAGNVEEVVQNGARDCIVWKPFLDEKFTLKSAWKGSWKDQQQVGVGQQQVVWRAVWSKLIFPNISVFVWRFLRKRLPVDEVLQRRGVYLASKCYCCDSVESWDHLFYHGAIALEVWRYFAQLFGVDRFLVFENWRRGRSWSYGGHIREAIPFLIIWFYAVGIIKPGHWKGFVMAAQNLGLLVKPRTVNTISMVTWKKPKVGWFKLNTDGCSKGNPGLSSFGVIIRDHSGNVMMVKEANAAADHIANQAFISLVDDGLDAPLDLYTDRICYNHEIDKELDGICNLDKSGLPYIRGDDNSTTVNIEQGKFGVDGDVNEAIKMNAVETGEAATAAALKAAAGAEVWRSSGCASGLYGRKQKIEATYGYKVPDSDGRRHPLILTVSDYKRRRGLL